MEQDGPHSLIPLDLAVRAIHERVYEFERLSDDRLNLIALALASVVPIFTYDRHPDSMREVQEGELRAGHFAEEARVLVFGDGRPPIRSLAIHESGFNDVVATLSRKLGS